VSILGAHDKAYYDKVAAYKKSLETMVEEKCGEIKKLGTKGYIKTFGLKN